MKRVRFLSRLQRFLLVWMLCFLLRLELVILLPMALRNQLLLLIYWRVKTLCS